MSLSEKKVLKFKVSSFRRIPNPYITSNNIGEKRPEMFILICDIKDIPVDIPMDTNPRKQNEKTKVAKKIQNSLVDHSERSFYLLNRGLLLSAKDISYNNETNEVSILFEDSRVHGNVDGGHTYEIIKENSVHLEKGEQYVKVEVVTGIEDIFEQLAAARNTSVQVKDQSIAELEKRFELIKEAFRKERFYNDISYKENDVKRIDVTDLLALLNLFNIDKYPTDKLSSMPINSYSSKKTCTDIYIQYSKNCAEDQTKNPYFKMKEIMPDIVKLYDELETRMQEFYKGDSTGVKKYGAITGVMMVKSGKERYRSKFYESEMDYSTPNGFIYPILGAFRALVIEENGVYKWSADPFVILDELGSSLVGSTIQMSRDLGNNPNATGKNSNLWQTLFMLVKMTIMKMK
ncbi:AIPR family protein [Anaerorhabdus sp.]|uniref:AIPR family protein n=1 Tax=Anaerorhabdus sp. TaxID=1872524 RepID=UPI002FC7B42D